MSSANDSRPALPVRTSRFQRTGRHSSPHQLSLPPEAPALVLAAPGTAGGRNDEVVQEVADRAAASCPGIPVEYGYLGGGAHALTDVLTSLGSHEQMPSAVVVPLFIGPDPAADAALASAVASAAARILTAGHLGPHPLLAEALHTRLAESGLARQARAGRLSIVSEADGFLVGSAGGEEAFQVAGVVAVLLASRLALPTAPVPLDDPAGTAAGAERLRAARVSRIALAPCVVGPEIGPHVLDAAMAAAGASACAPPLGAHPAIGQLVAIRYGAALDDPKLAANLAR